MARARSVEESTESKMNKWWIQTGITILIIVASWAVAWGAIATKIQALEQRGNDIRSDHDLLISVNAKMDIMMRDLVEVKGDVKKHLEVPVKP